MAEQRENPDRAASMARFKASLNPGPGNLFSGAQFENFKHGWAHAVMRDGKVSHWFERDGFDNARALCGAESLVRWVYGPGNHPKCQRCIHAQTKMIRSGNT